MSQEMVLLFTGNGGSGKSATANTLLGYNAFPKNNNTTPTVTETVVKKTLDQTLTIVDGLCLWGKDPKNLQEDTYNYAQRAVSKCGSGFNAILFVMKYGETYSDEDARVVAVAKKVFGPKIFEEFGICVFTRGDDFKYAVKEGEEPCTTFSEWYNSRSGNLKQLVGECGRRCVLFDNKEKDPKETNSLLKLVNHLSKNGTKRYTLKDFQECHGREFSASVSKTMIEKTLRDELESIREEFNGNAKRTELPKMLNKLSDLSKKISLSHIDQKIIESLESVAQTLTTNIKMQLDKCEQHSDKEIPTTRPGFSSMSTFDKDSNLHRFSADYFNQTTGGCDQNKATQADRLINDFRGNTFHNGVEREKHYVILKSQVLELLQSSQYLETFKSKLSLLEQEIRNQLALESSNVEEDLADAIESSDEICDTDKVETSNDVKLLLLGRSGNGKSSTGNSLLGKPAFQISSSVAASKSMIATESQRFEQFTLKVVDGPSLDDSTLNSSKGLDEMLKSMKEALQLCDYGFSCLLVILKFGQRFTKQEKNAVGLIKSILGKDVLRMYGVCVMTHGDNYDSEMEEEKIDFVEWCRSQTSEIAELFEECSYRCVLINNKTRDQEIQMKQRNKVLDLIKREGKYSEEEFLDAGRDFKDLSIQCAMPHLEQENSVILSKIREKLQKLEREFPNREGQYRLELESMQQALQEYIYNLESLGHNATIDYLLQLVSTLQMQINSKLRLCQQAEELQRLEKEKARIQENVSSPPQPLHLRQDGLPATKHYISPDRRSSEAMLTINASRCSSLETRKHLKELKDFVQDTKMRWGQVNKNKPILRTHMGVILKDIDFRLKEVEMRGERIEASDLAYAELIQLKELIEGTIRHDRSPQPSQSYYQPSILTYPKEYGYVYSHQGIGVDALSYTSSTQAEAIHSSPRKNQTHRSKLPKVTGGKIKTFIKKRWSEMESFLSNLFTTPNNLYA